MGTVCVYHSSKVWSSTQPPLHWSMRLTAEAAESTQRRRLTTRQEEEVAGRHSEPEYGAGGRPRRWAVGEKIV